MNSNCLFRSLVAVTIPLLMVVSVRADEAVVVTNFGPTENAASGNKGDSQPDCDCNAASCGGVCSRPGCGCGNLCFGARSGFVGGAEVAFLKPSFNDNTALISTHNTSLPTLASGSDSYTDFASGYQASPRIWLGYMNSCGFGGRIRYWEYDQAMDQAGTAAETATTQTSYTTSNPVDSVSTTAAGDKVITSENLHLYTVDVEMTQWMQIGCWDFTFGSGIRDAAVHIDRVDTLVAVATSQLVSNTANARNHFDGIGPTLFTDFRRPFGCHGLAFVGNVRGSLLYGTKSLRATDAFQVAGVGYSNEFDYDHTDTGWLGVAELSLGIEWSKEILGNTTVFARGMWENQYWANTGNNRHCGR